jgi:hypothetical protein
MAGTIGVDNTREELRKLYSRDPEKSLLKNAVRCLADPIKPLDEKGRFRPHPLLVWLLAFGLVAGSVFIYFSCTQP